jgi:hypothetical protein
MKQNVGVLDTAIRAVISVVLIALAVEGIFAAPVSIAMASVGIILFFTCGTGVCPLYKVLGIDTYPTFTEYHYK